MLTLTKENFRAEVEEAESLVVVDIYAPWCGPCRMLAPIFEELEAELACVKFAKLNVDDEPDIARLFRVESVPTVALVKGGVFLDLRVGFMPKEELASFIGEYI